MSLPGGADPQTERGFVMIALDLFAALAAADWPKREWLVLGEILLQCYGPAKRREAHVDPRLLEHYSGLADKNVYRALRSLKAAGVIRETEHGGYTFNKHYDTWTRPGAGVPPTPPEPLLGPGERKYAGAAVERFGRAKPIKAKANVGVPLDTDGIQRDTDLDQKRYPTGYQFGADSVSNGILGIIGTRASEENSRLEINQDLREFAGEGNTPEPGPESRPEPEPPRPESPADARRRQRREAVRRVDRAEKEARNGQG